MNLLETLRWIRWLSGHLDKVPGIITLVQVIKVATTYRVKWQGIKSLGDLIVDMLEDAPVATVVLEIFEAVGRAELESHRDAMIAASINWDQLIALLPQIAAIVRAIIAALRGESTSIAA